MVAAAGAKTKELSGGAFTKELDAGAELAATVVAEMKEEEVTVGFETNAGGVEMKFAEEAKELIGGGTEAKQLAGGAGTM